MRYEYKALVLRVIDGDSLELDVDLGLRVFTRCRLRLLGIDAPEIGTAAGKASREALFQLVPTGAHVFVRTEMDRTEKYGRWLGTVFYPQYPTKTVNQSMVDAGHAKPYDGGPRPIT